MTPSKTLSFFALLAFITSAVWLALVWHWPWADLWRDPDTLPLAQAAVQMAVLPEIAAAFLAGGLLALASTALQQVVHNPLASDSTLAVAGGAQLALMLVTLFFPAAGLFGSFWVAFAGAVAAMLLVLLVAGAGGANALALILAGLLANMVFAAIAAVISQFYSNLLLGIMVWGAGSLLQDGWATVTALLWTSLAAALALALLHRPLTLLALDDEQARRLGAPVGLLRLLVLLLAAGVTAQVVSRLGVISFAGLAGASVAHLLRVRAMGARFALSFLAGGLLLVVDSLLNIAGHFLGTLLPAGALCGVLGAPFLIFLVLRQGKSAQGFAREAPPSAPSPRLASWRTPLLGLAVLLALLVLSQGFTTGADGWGWHWQGELILDHRLPRSLSAMAVGIMLACAGVLLQTLTRNPMASPEVLGISSGVALAVIAAFLAFPALGSGGLLLAGAGGVLMVAVLVLWLARRLQPAWLLVTGVAIAALMQGVMTVVQLSGNPQLQGVLSWLAGSTWYARPHTAPLLVLLALVLLAAALLCGKALQLLALGETVAGSLGISYQRNDKDGAMWGGLPVTYTDGSFTNWKRGKSDSTNWSYWDSRTTNLFIEGKQALNDNWNVSLKADHRNATGDSELFYFSGGSVNRNGLDWTPWPGKFHTDAKQNTIQLQTDGKIQAWGQEHDLIAGIQYNRHHRSSYSWDKGDIAPASDFNTWNGNYPRPNWGARSLSHDQTDTETALYAATRLRITDQLSTIIGTRVSNWKSTGESYTKPFTQKNSAIWTPYAGITYDITPNQTVYASYADIYKPQTERDRNNNLLDPIRGSTYELGWKANWLDGRLNTQASAYRTRQDKLAQSSSETIAGVTPPTTAYYAAKGAKVSGFELEASGNASENLRLGAGYTQWRGKDAKGKALNTTHPRQQLKLFAAYDVPSVSGLTVGGGVAWQSRTWIATENPATGAEIDYGQKSYAVVNLMSRYQINEHLSAQINIDNLFDKKYRNQLSFNQYGYGDPRYISASFKYEF
ncbi:iron chelate uptake ABC transporter family permease subunit [Cardiobacterium hominis]|uniref:iron chelate uptake ABC transporter family permease subunit n=1 Tax=Cardiobacterium hominis TaxID=2718 RepID=UPI0028E6753E|nr:iron chelate uptake ABC transporter family permease subunit [Cardiobacterium hominis]